MSSSRNEESSNNCGDGTESTDPSLPSDRDIFYEFFSSNPYRDLADPWQVQYSRFPDQMLGSDTARSRDVQDYDTTNGPVAGLSNGSRSQNPLCAEEITTDPTGGESNILVGRDERGSVEDGLSVPSNLGLSGEHNPSVDPSASSLRYDEQPRPSPHFSAPFTGPSHLASIPEAPSDPSVQLFTDEEFTEWLMRTVFSDDSTKESASSAPLQERVAPIPNVTVTQDEPPAPIDSPHNSTDELSTANPRQDLRAQTLPSDVFRDRDEASRSDTMSSNLLTCVQPLGDPSGALSRPSIPASLQLPSHQSSYQNTDNNRVPTLSPSVSGPIGGETAVVSSSRKRKRASFSADARSNSGGLDLDAPPPRRRALPVPQTTNIAYPYPLPSASSAHPQQPVDLRPFAAPSQSPSGLTSDATSLPSRSTPVPPSSNRKRKDPPTQEGSSQVGRGPTKRIARGRQIVSDRTQSIIPTRNMRALPGNIPVQQLPADSDPPGSSGAVGNYQIGRMPLVVQPTQSMMSNATPGPSVLTGPDFPLSLAPNRFAPEWSFDTFSAQPSAQLTVLPPGNPFQYGIPQHPFAHQVSSNATPNPPASLQADATYPADTVPAINTPPARRRARARGGVRAASTRELHVPEGWPYPSPSSLQRPIRAEGSGRSQPGRSLPVAGPSSMPDPPMARPSSRPDAGLRHAFLPVNTTGLPKARRRRKKAPQPEKEALVHRDGRLVKHREIMDYLGLQKAADRECRCPFPGCDATFVGKRGCNKHINAKHVYKDHTGRFPCMACTPQKKPLDTRQSLERHVHDSHLRIREAQCSCGQKLVRGIPSSIARHFRIWRHRDDRSLLGMRRVMINRNTGAILEYLDDDDVEEDVEEDEEEDEEEHPGDDDQAASRHNEDKQEGTSRGRRCA